MAAITVHIIPTGDSIQPAGGQPFATVEALHQWVSAETGISQGDIIILTGKGKHVQQQQQLLTEVRIHTHTHILYTFSQPFAPLYNHHVNEQVYRD
jgi:hypothetical protein